MQGTTVMSSTYLKRGHHHDFALTEDEIEALISSATSSTTKAILILASRGLKVKEIVEWTARDSNPLLRGCKQEYLDVLGLFPVGFNVSSIAVWRRVRKAIIKAGEKKIIHVEEDHVPFPEALRYRRKPPEINYLRSELESIGRRIHVLNGGFRDTRDPLDNCPHLDCIAVRDVIESLSHYPELLRKEVSNDRKITSYGEGPRISPP